MYRLNERLTELDEILKYMDDEDWVKIPDEVIFYIRENKSKDYVWKYDESKSIEEQNVNRDTVSLLSYITYTYITNSEEKTQLEEVFEKNEQDLKEKHNVENLFKNNNSNIEYSSESKPLKLDFPEMNSRDVSSNEIDIPVEGIKLEEISLTPIEDVGIFCKIKIFFKNLFSKK